MRLVLNAMAMCLAVGVLAPLAQASVVGPVTVPLTGPGGDSGWDVSYNSSIVAISVSMVEEGSYVEITIDKDFLQPPNPVTGLFPPILIDFIQRLPDAQTAPTIRILDESIYNGTGVHWTDFHWEVLNQGEAWFDPEGSEDFGIEPPPSDIQMVPPFLNQHWGMRPGNPNLFVILDVDGGLGIAPGGYFSPSPATSMLVIQTDLGANQTDNLSFTFKQFPTPEPATLALVGLGLGGLVARRKRRR